MAAGMAVRVGGAVCGCLLGLVGGVALGDGFVVDGVFFDWTGHDVTGVVRIEDPVGDASGAFDYELAECKLYSEKLRVCRLV